MSDNDPIRTVLGCPSPCRACGKAIIKGQYAIYFRNPNTGPSSDGPVHARCGDTSK